MRIFTFVIAFCIAIVSYQCRTARPGTAVAPTLQPTTQPSLLWQIHGKDLAQPSYLYGTIHLIDKAHFFMSAATKKAFAESKKVAFEINMNEMGDLSGMTSLLMGSMMKGDTTLRDLLTPAEYKEVETVFNELGMPLMFLERMKPMLLSMMTEIDMTSLSPDATPDTDGMMSYEMEFAQMAQDQKKPVEGLETAAYQLSLFDSIPYKVQARMLLESLHSTDKQSAEMDDMIKLYKAQDIEAMANMVSAASDMASYDELLLNNRNRNWIPVIERLIHQQPTFIAVGAGHLGGEQGVISLLRKQGYTVQALYNR